MKLKKENKIMKQEEKELLLKDLCCRLPYEVIVKDRNGVHKLTAGNTEFTDLLYNGKCNIRPYLFPLSSITEEQLLELSSISFENSIDSSIKTLNWCYKNHFDIYRLIPMGLAIDATNLNIY